MKQRLSIVLSLLLTGFCGFAQSVSFEVVSDVEIRDKSGNKLDLGVIGGVNQPQFYNLDINNDGILDLFVFERTGAKTLSLIHDGNGNYTYEPKFDQIYPGRFTTWVVFKDYNVDGLPDLWFYSEDDDAIALYKNVTRAADVHAQFELADDRLRAYNFNTPPLDTNDLYCDRTNIPAIEDIDGDGDIDFMTLQTLGFGITLFLNNTVELGKPLDPPQFEIADECWGDFVEFDGTNQIEFKRDKFCFHKFYRHLKKKHAGGSSLLVLDNDEDGDLDLIMGNAGLGNLLFLENGKADNGMKIDTMIASDSMFPSGTRRAEMVTFPASYYQDVDGDNVKDLIVAVNMFDKRSYNFRETENIFYYKNKGKNDKPDFQIMDTSLFSSDMVDHGGYSAPVLWDVDNDDDLDLILATNGDWGLTQDLADFLVLYENVGSKTTPIFQLAVEDYLGLRKDSIQNLAPCLGDLNRDGNPELLVGRLNGSLSLYNILGSGKTATSSKVSDNSFGVQVDESSTPFLGDVDGDGYIDLLVGSYQGKTQYFRNTSTTSTPVFVKEKDTIGGVLPGFWRMELQFDPVTNTFFDSLVFRTVNYASPAMLDLDNNGDPEFIVGDARGRISIYRDIRTTGFDSFTAVEETPFYLSGSKQCYDYNFGALASPTFGDLNDDGRPDLIVGDNRGGFQIAMASGTCNVGIDRIEPTKQSLNIYPNPTSGWIYFDDISTSNALLKVISLNGQTVYSETVNPSNGVDLSALSEGIYVIQLVSSSENRVTKLIKLNP